MARAASPISPAAPCGGAGCHRQPSSLKDHFVQPEANFGDSNACIVVVPLQDISRKGFLVISPSLLHTLTAENEEVDQAAKSSFKYDQV